MKTRIGFVSNSSSCSFCIYGVVKTETELKAIKEKQGITTYYSSDFPLPKNISINQPPNDLLYIGREWCTIGDDETGSQFKKNVVEELTKLLKEEVKCETYSEGWYDG